MKKLLLSLVAIATISLSSFGQSPEAFKYQAVIRDAGNLILNNQAVGMRLSIQQGAIGGMAVYTETFAITTNAYGLVNLEIGTGTTTDDFTLIDWANGPYFIETAVDAAGGTSYAVMGTSQLLSVPYALHAKTAEFVTNDLVNDADSDSTNEIQSLMLSGDTIVLSDGGSVLVPAPVLNDTGGKSQICSGSTTAGADWLVWGTTALVMTVNTSGCGFTSTPKYFTSVGGAGSHFELVGASAIYSPTPTGFTIYIRKNDESLLTPADAVAGGWFINWQAIGD
jgi:hypothetical protein